VGVLGFGAYGQDTDLGGVGANVGTRSKYYIVAKYGRVKALSPRLLGRHTDRRCTEEFPTKKNNYDVLSLVGKSYLYGYHTEKKDGCSRKSILPPSRRNFIFGAIKFGGSAFLLGGRW